MRFAVSSVMQEIEAIHREMARLAIEQRLGLPSALRGEDILNSHAEPMKQETIERLRQERERLGDTEEGKRVERILFACMDLVIDKEVSSLVDMVNFYAERGRMHVRGEKVPMLDVVPWLQKEDDFDKREEMRSECNIFFKVIMNPMLLGVLELTIRAVQQQAGFENYISFNEAKMNVSFDDYASRFTDYLQRTDQIYRERMEPWVEAEIRRPFEDLSRYHALYLMRIRAFDSFFPVSDLKRQMEQTFRGLGFDLTQRNDVILDISDQSSKNPDGVCVGVDVPGEVHVLVKPVGGMIDAETLLHEMGHAFFLSNFDARLPLEYRRLYRSPAVDETVAFLFMELLGSRSWLTEIAGLPERAADDLAARVDTKRLCLIRRHMGKFLAEKQLHETGEIKNPEPYCSHLERATGFSYEPQGYLVDMDPEFYALSYVRAWGGAHVLTRHLERSYGERWYASSEAGAFLKSFASQARKLDLDELLRIHCSEAPVIPDLLDR